MLMLIHMNDRSANTQFMNRLKYIVSKSTNTALICQHYISAYFKIHSPHILKYIPAFSAYVETQSCLVHKPTIPEKIWEYLRYVGIMGPAEMCVEHIRGLQARWGLCMDCGAGMDYVLGCVSNKYRIWETSRDVFQHIWGLQGFYLSL